LSQERSGGSEARRLCYRREVARALDTSIDAALLQEQAYREIGPVGRLKIALELSDLTHAFAVAGIRRNDPSLTEEEARCRLAERLYGQTSKTR
jgi:hypothetical protein